MLVAASRPVAAFGRHGAARRSGLADPRVLVVVHRHGCWNLERIFLATGAGTIDDTSPPKRAMSRMYFDAIAALAEADGRNTVWTPETLRLIWACAISLS